MVSQFLGLSLQRQYVRITAPLFLCPATLATLQHHHGSGLEEASYMQHSLDLCSGAHKHGELVVLPEVGLALGLVVRFLWGMWGEELEDFSTNRQVPRRLTTLISRL